MRISVFSLALVFLVYLSGCGSGKSNSNAKDTVKKDQNLVDQKKIDTLKNNTQITQNTIDTTTHENVIPLVNKELIDIFKLNREANDFASKNQNSAAMGKWEQFVSKCEAVENNEKYSKELEGQKNVRAKAMANYASLAIKTGQNLNEASKMLEKAQKIDPSYAPTYMLLGDIYAQLGDKSEAQDEYKKYIALPNISPAEKDLAQRKLSGSVNSFVVENTDAETPATINEKKQKLAKYHNDAQGFIKENDEKKALVALNMYEETSATYEKSPYLQQVMLAGLAKQRAENLVYNARFSEKKGLRRPEVLKLVQKATELDPTNGEAWIKTGDILAGQFDKSGALAAYDKAEACKLTPEQKQNIAQKRKGL